MAISREEARELLDSHIDRRVDAKYITARIGQYIGNNQWQQKEVPPGYVAITFENGLEAEAYADGRVVPLPGQKIEVQRVSGVWRVRGTAAEAAQEGDNAPAERGLSVGLHGDNIGNIHFVPFDEASMVDGGAEIMPGTTNVKFYRKMYIDDAGQAKVYAGGDTVDVAGTYGNSLAGGKQAWVLVYIAPSTGALSFHEAAGADAPINATTDLGDALDDFYTNVSAGVPYLAVRVGRGAINYKRYKPTSRYDFDSKDIVRFVVEQFTTLASLADIDLASITDGAILKYDGGAQEWADSNLQIDELGDVNTSAPFNSAHYLGYNAGVWVNRFIRLGELGNVRTDDVTTGNILIASGGAFESHPLSVDDVQEGALNHEYGGLEADVSSYGGIPLISGGSTSEIKYNLSATDDPDTNDDTGSGYVVGSLWVNTPRGRTWQCVDNTSSAAVWQLIGGAYGAFATLSANQSIANSSLTTIAFDGSDYDTDSMLNTTTGVITIPRDGLWALTAGAQFANNSTGQRLLLIKAGGAFVPRSRAGAIFGSERTSAVDAIQLASGDTVEAQVEQNSGGSLDVQDNASTFLTVRYVGKV